MCASVLNMETQTATNGVNSMPNFIELANIVVNELRKDGMIEYFTKCNKADSVSTVLEYIEPAIKRFDKYAVMYKTNDDFKNHVNKMVLSTMQ